MSDDLEIAKLRTTSPATGTAEMIRRCHWAHARIEALEAENARLRDTLVECENEIDAYIWQEYPSDHPVHKRYRKRDFSANPARVALQDTATDTAPKTAGNDASQ